VHAIERADEGDQGKYLSTKTKQFSAGLRKAAGKGQKVSFH
jgi:hypothetical protein